MTHKPILEVDDLQVAYGPVRALRGCSMRVFAGEAVAIVGANGAGKTTLLRATTNVVRRQSGDIRLNGNSIGRRPSHLLAREGLMHIPEGRGVLGSLTVRENLRLVYDAGTNSASFEAALAKVFERFPRLQERIDQKAGSMSGGEQQMLALSRALVRFPQVLLVDEPSLGLSPLLVNEMFTLLESFRASGMTILVVEQHARSVFAFADRGYILRHGQFVLEGKGSDLLRDMTSLRHYLGTD